jgi:hypothetical protein
VHYPIGGWLVEDVEIDAALEGESLSVVNSWVPSCRGTLADLA